MDRHTSMSQQPEGHSSVHEGMTDTWWGHSHAGVPCSHDQHCANTRSTEALRDPDAMWHSRTGSAQKRPIQRQEVGLWVVEFLLHGNRKVLDMNGRDSCTDL